jgi:hypothetical protein
VCSINSNDDSKLATPFMGYSSNDAPPPGGLGLGLGGRARWPGCVEGIRGPHSQRRAVLLLLCGGATVDSLERAEPQEKGKTHPQRPPRPVPSFRTRTTWWSRISTSGGNTAQSRASGCAKGNRGAVVDIYPHREIDTTPSRRDKHL